jgi:nucleoside-diphosphate-sugar epimerase
MKINIITGATGFVGKYLVNALLEKGERVWIIVRPLNNESVKKRTEQMFCEHMAKWPDTFRVIEGDIMIKDLGIKDSIINELKNNEVVLWHLAANLSFSAENRADVQKTNYTGTINAVEFANKTAHKFVHMSTAYVCGNSTSFKEDELCKGQKPRNHYEESKIRAEKYVNDNCNIPFIIFRPSIIIGDAYQGKAEGCTFGYYRYTFMFYFLKKQIIKTLQKDGIVALCLKILGTKYDQNDNILKTPWLIIPYPRNGRVDMVTVDFVIASMIKLHEKNLHHTAVHLTHHNPPAHRLILHSIIHDVGFRGMKLAPVPVWMFRVIANSFYFLIVPVRKYIKSIMWYIPYITKECQFNRSIIEKYGENPPEITRELLEKINSYAKENILEHIEI